MISAVGKAVRQVSVGSVASHDCSHRRSCRRQHTSRCVASDEIGGVGELWVRGYCSMVVTESSWQVVQRCNYKLEGGAQSGCPAIGGSQVRRRIQLGCH